MRRSVACGTASRPLEPLLGGGRGGHREVSRCGHRSSVVGFDVARLDAAPAGDLAGGSQRAAVDRAGADRAERRRGRVRLPPTVVAPAGDGAVDAQRAAVARAGADRAEPARRRVGLPPTVVSPAGEGAVDAQRAAVARTRADRAEPARRRVGPTVLVVSPAGEGAVVAQPATEAPTGGDGGEAARRRVALARTVVAPAGDGPVDAQAATVQGAGADRAEPAGRRVGLPPGAVAPAGDGPLDAQPAAMPRTRGDRAEAACRRLGLPPGAVAPAGDGAVAAQPASMGPSCSHGDEDSRFASRRGRVDGHLGLALVAPQEGDQFLAGKRLVGRERRGRGSGGDAGLAQPRHGALLPVPFDVCEGVTLRSRSAVEPPQKRRQLGPRHSVVGREGRARRPLGDSSLEHPRNRLVLRFDGHIDERVLGVRFGAALSVPKIHRSLTARRRRIGKEATAVDAGDGVLDGPLHGLGEIHALGDVSVPRNRARGRRIAHQ